MIVYFIRFNQADVEHIDGHATFDSDGVCHVGDIQLKGEHTMIATGGNPLVPNIPGNIYYLAFKCWMVTRSLQIAFYGDI